MSPTFLGLVILAAAVVFAAALVNMGLCRVAEKLDARNAMLAAIGKTRGTRVPALHDDAGKKRQWPES